MDKIMSVELSGKGDTYATVTLPLTPYEMLDTLDKLRMTPEEEPDWEICQHFTHRELHDWIGSGSVYELNALCTIVELICDGNNLGFLLDERAQGMQGFEQKLAAAMEYDDCRTLKDVIGCAEEIRRFSFVMADKLEDYAKTELKKAGAPEALIEAGLFDLTGFAEDSLERSGYRLDRTESVYLKPRQQEQQMTQGAMSMEQTM